MSSWTGNVISENRGEKRPSRSYPYEERRDVTGHDGNLNYAPNSARHIRSPEWTGPCPQCEPDAYAKNAKHRKILMSSEATTAPSDVAQTGGGPTTHAPAREPLSAFRWPCERHYAHGPHDGCPGVDAHPLTMIGGRYSDDR